MQLTIISIVIFLVVFTQDVKAQFYKKIFSKKSDKLIPDSTEQRLETYENHEWRTIDLDILSSYYMQDGNNSPVTGGIGTEELTDMTQKIILKVPLSPKLDLNLDGGYDYYTSASSDNIDPARSSASGADMRVHGNIGFQYQVTDQLSWGMRAGSSVEYDYVSLNGGLNGMYMSKDENTSLSLNLQAFFDTWSLIYPKELRGDGRLVPTDQRRSYNGSLAFSRVFNERMQWIVQLEGIYMTGLLSTPFHRVYFQDQEAAKVEQLPETRLKLPIGTRLNISIADWLILRTYYRYYWDDWGITAHTGSIELPIKINRFFSIYPHYRYHTQSAANYFLPYKEHLTSSEFYTSDYDLAELDSHSYGLGISYSPAFGIGGFKLPFKKHPKFTFDKIELKYSHYTRSTAFTADIISLGLGFKF